MADTVAELAETGRTAPPWLYLVEWQTEPDPDMFGRLLVELGQLWQKHRPDPHPGSRYQLAAAVVNPTGTRGSLPASWEFTLPGPDGTACILRVRERYLAEESADEMLRRIERGEVARCVLPLIVLMQGGGEDGIIQRWLAAAALEPDAKRRGEYGLLAATFAELKDWGQAWVTALKGWNMRESQTALKWRREGKIEAKQETLRQLLELRFGQLPGEVIRRIETATELATLEAAIGQVLTITRTEDILP